MSKQRRENSKLRMRRILEAVSVFIIVVIISVNTGQSTEASWIPEARATLSKTDSYSATFHKQERIKGRLKAKEVVFLKFGRPFKVYMKWIKEPGIGREVLYVEGWNQNKIKVRESWMGTGFSINIDPQGGIAMGSSRHPITDSGLEKFLSLLETNVRKGILRGETQFGELGEEIVYGSKSRKIEYLFPKESTRGYYCYRTVVNLDLESKVPIRARIYDWEGLLVEDYGYENLKLNTGLTDLDFDPKNPEYRFLHSSAKNQPLETRQK
jgi:outer membrane lipoprotein-sorting protein